MRVRCRERSVEVCGSRSSSRSPWPSCSARPCAVAPASPTSPPPSRSATQPAAVIEGQPATFPITLDQTATADYRVPWTTSEGNSGSFDVHAGDTTEPSITVPTNSNSTPEDDRTFTVTLAHADRHSRRRELRRDDRGARQRDGNRDDHRRRLADRLDRDDAGERQRPRERRSDDRLHGLAGRGQRTGAPSDHRRLRRRGRLRPERPRLHDHEPGRRRVRDADVHTGQLQASTCR